MIGCNMTFITNINHSSIHITITYRISIDLNIRIHLLLIYY